MTAYTFGTDTNKTFTELMDQAFRVPPEPKFGPGDEVTVTLTGTVAKGSNFNDWTFVAPTYRGPLYLANRTLKLLTVDKKATPTWKAGDVIAVRYNSPSKEYTYVRGSWDWPGDGQRLSDAEVNRKWRNGEIRHLLRDAKPVTA